MPIPGAQQHKRPRRRYEEIERMYKCGWNGCEKAYGTLNHLNAHVTMQSHGQKRTPEGESTSPFITGPFLVGKTAASFGRLVWLARHGSRCSGRRDETRAGAVEFGFPGMSQPGPMRV